MPRGGHREGAGRKGGWKNSETQVIRVPKVFVAQLLDIARLLDSGRSENLVLSVSPEMDPIQLIDESEILQVDPDQMDLFSLIPDVIESVTKSKSISLSMRGLAEYLGIHHSSISRKLKKQPLEEVLLWIQSKGKGLWIFDAESKRFTQVSEDLDCEDF
jgi:hypothetical protein